MNRSRSQSLRVLWKRSGRAVTLATLLSVGHGGSAVLAAPSYDDGAGNGCVQCHNGFVGGNGPLHQRHRIDFGITSCNACHPSGGGSTPVLTYWSGPGGGLGCAGCHGNSYGEVSPNSGQPKASAYGLRQFHVANGVTSCGTGGCHQPGSLGHSNPFPPLAGEDVPPPYYGTLITNLSDPCSSAQEDLLLDSDTVGLDNDGDGLADWPADPDCPVPTTTTTTSTTTTTTIPLDCGLAPAMGCAPAARGALVVNEKTAGKEKLRVALKALQPVVLQSDFGNPVTGATAYAICVYDAANTLRGEYDVARAGASCGSVPCWAALKGDKGYKYGDKAATADGIVRLRLGAGDAGKGKISASGNNKAAALPTGVAAGLQNATAATVQILTSDASCFEIGLVRVKKADGLVFNAVTP